MPDTTAPAGPGIPTITVVSRCDEALATDVAAVTAAAYRHGDLVGGLPVADGAHETASTVRDDLATGRRLWVARWDGHVVGAVRASAPAPDTWEVHRLAVAPRIRHGGVARGLIRALEDDARAAGARRVRLDAVVERGNPAFYARLGYRTVRHFGAADKPLSEVHMVRDLDAPATPVGYPGGDTPAGLVVAWYATAGGTWCRTGPTLADLTDLVGVDCRRDASSQPASRFHPAPAATIPAFVQPRLVHPDLLAWWRLPAARRPPPG